MNTQLIVCQYQNKVEECLQGVQYELDLSFSRIDEFLDQLLLVPCPPVLHKSVNDAPKLSQLSFPSIQNFAKQLIQEVQTILTNHNEFQQNQQQLTLLEQSNTNTKENNNEQLFTYNLIQNHSIQQSEWCYSIAINNDNSIVLVGCYNKIKVFEFKQEQLKLIQLLSGHSNQNAVTTLNFMNKSTQFISGSYQQIIIWSMDQHSQWICQYKLNEHSHSIKCLILNSNEDLIISGSNDKTIKFWKRQNQWACSQTITDHTNDVLGLSLNEKQNRVISCGVDKIILIIEESQQNQKWNVIQKITVEQYGYRICFIDDILHSLSHNFGVILHRCIIIIANSLKPSKNIVFSFPIL